MTNQRATPWAILPEARAEVVRLMRAGALARIRTEEDEDHPRPAAGRSSIVTGGIAVLNLTGVITPRGSWIQMLFGGSGGLQSFRAQFREALGNDDIAAILINIDSPGGLVDLVPETAAEIRAARGRKPIVAIANTMAASAAYWIGSQADELVVTPSGEVGSIGVFLVHDDWSGFNEQLGVDPTYIFAGKHKTEGNPDEPLSDEAKAHFQEQVDEIYGMFLRDVARGRGVSTSVVREKYGEGRTLSAQKAAAAGMVDRIDTFEGTVAKLVGKRGRNGALGESAEVEALERQLQAQTERSAQLEAELQTFRADSDDDDDDEPELEAESESDDDLDPGDESDERAHGAGRELSSEDFAAAAVLSAD